MPDDFIDSLMTMQPKLITYFLTVAKELNFSRSARRLGVGQPVLSRGIKELENRLGVELFNRSTTDVSLTEAGEAFLPKIDESMLLMDEAILAARSIARRNDDNFDIGYLPSSLLCFLGEAMDVFTQAFPQANVEMHEMSPARQIDALQKGKIDIALAGYVCDGIEKEFDLFNIYKRPISLVVAKKHPFMKMETPDLKLFEESELVTLNTDSFPGRKRYIRSVCERAGIQPKSTKEVDSLMNALAIIATKNAFSFMPEELKEMAPQQVEFIPMGPELGEHSFTALVRKDEARKQIRTFLEECRRVTQS